MAADAAVAAVSGIVGIERFAVVFRGQAGHPATVPTAARDDAVVRAAEFICRYWTVVAALGPRAITNIGRIEVSPGDLNVIPHTVRVFVEQRSPTLDRGARRPPGVAARAGGRRRRRGRGTHARRSGRVRPELRRLTLDAAAQAGIECPEQPSWAGHDAEQFVSVCPAGMIFVRNIGGVSHDPRELGSEPDIATGLQLLLTTLRRVDAALDSRDYDDPAP